MNPIEFHPFEMQFEVPGTDGQTVYTRRFQAPRHFKLHFKWMKFYRIHDKFLFFCDNL